MPKRWPNTDCDAASRDRKQNTYLPNNITARYCPQERNRRAGREPERTAKDADSRYCCTPSTATSRANRLQHHRRTAEEEERETELAQTRREIKTDKLKGVAVNVTTKAVERIGALFHDPKPARYEKQIADLQDIIEGKDKDIKSLQREITTMQVRHDKEKDKIK